MEREAVPQFTLYILLWSHPSKLLAILAQTLSYSMRIWDKLKNYSELVSPIRPLAHLFHNPQFPPGMNIRAFRWWLNKGLYRIGHYFNSSGPDTFNHCINNLKMPSNKKYRHQQISQFLHSIWKSKPLPPNITPYEQWCSQLTEQRGGIMVIYESLSVEHNKTSYVLARERDLK